MKIIDYINSNATVLNQENIFTLQKYEQLIQYFTVSQPTKYVNIRYNQETMHNGNIANTLLPITNQVILLTNLDFDFPPPKVPYEYDMFFNPDLLPANYLDIPYLDKINPDVLHVIVKNDIHIFTHSVSINHPNIHMIPAGVFSKFYHFHMKTNSKDTLCYANFGLSCDRWFGNPRNEVVEFIKNKNIQLKWSDEII